MTLYYPAIRLYRTPFLKEIFNQDSSGYIKPTSLYYQHIIRYFLRDVNAHFKLREVLNEIIKVIPIRTRKDQSVADSNKNDIIEYGEKTFRKYFENLVDWRVLTARQTYIEKGTGSTFEYKITRFGNLLALLIETDFNKNKDSHDSLYFFWNLLYHHHYASLSLVYHGVQSIL